MKNNIIKINQKLVYLEVAVLVFLCYLIANVTIDSTGYLVKTGMGICLSVLICFSIVQFKKNIPNKEWKITILIMAGMVLRIGYMSYNSVQTRSYDLGDLTLDGYQHAAYILTLVQNAQLPDSNWGQYYQQPLFYVFGAIVSKIANAILGRTDSYSLVDAAKIISCYASCATLLLARKLSAFFLRSEKAKCIAVAMVAFLPQFILLSGRVNVDSLITFFMVATLAYTFYWYQDPSMKNTVFLALFYGFGMMTKISCAIIAFFTFILMMQKLIAAIKEKKTGKLLVKYLVFIGISFPLGLWYSLRNYILFSQPYTYVVSLADGAREGLYCGDHSFFQRFLCIDLKNLIQTPFADPWVDYNYPVFLVKSALFGEFQFEIALWIPIILLFVYGILVMLSVFAMFLPDKKKVFHQLFVAVLILGIMSIVFNVKSPYGCSMDFRYVAVLGVTNAIFLGRLVDFLIEKSADLDLSKQRTICMLLEGIALLVGCMAIFSTVMFLFLKG